MANLQHATVRSARVVGDNLAAVRYGAGTGRFRRLHLGAQMDQALRPLAERGWTLSWQAVRRQLNGAADRLATLGVHWASRLKHAGITAARTWTVWRNTRWDTPDHFPGLCDPLALDDVSRLCDELDAVRHPQN